MSKEGPKHLVIPDTHVKPDQDLRRFDWLSKIIMKERPDKIIILGDWADMSSLCSYDKGQRKFEGRRYNLDIEAANKALSRTFSPLLSYNRHKAEKKRKQYRPEIHVCLGNHENRIERATQMEPALDGILSVNQIEFAKYGATVHPFLAEVELDGVHYSHYFVSGVMARPIGGEHPASSLLAKQHRSCTAGHSHLTDFAQRRQVGGLHIMGCVAGCFFEHDEDYVPPSVSSMWWRGLVIKENVVNGCYDPRFYSLNTIKTRYLDAK